MREPSDETTCPAQSRVKSRFALRDASDDVLVEVAVIGEHEPQEREAAEQHDEDAM